MEQRRRDFEDAEPELYAYVTAREVARALDSAAHTVGSASSGKQAASRLSRLSSVIAERRKKIAAEWDAHE